MKNKLWMLLMASAFVLSFSTFAHATGNSNNSDNSTTNVETTINANPSASANNSNNVTSSPTSTSTSSNNVTVAPTTTNNNAVSSNPIASIFGSGNSSNTNKADADANVTNSGNSSSTSNSGVALSGNSASNSSVKNSGNSSASQSANNDVAVSYNNVQAKNPVSTASAPALAAGNDTCMGSSSAGGQGIGFGLSFGSTWTDEECVRRKNAAFVNTLGAPDVALAIIAQSEGVADAILAVGTPKQKAIVSKVKAQKAKIVKAERAEQKAKQEQFNK